MTVPDAARLTRVPPTDAPATYGRLLRTRGVAPLFGLSLANVLGMSLQIFALSVWIYRVTGSPLWSSAAFAAGFLPQLVGGAVLTSLADRWPARPVLAAGALVRAASGIALATGALPPAAAIGVVALVAVGQPLPAAVQSALVSRLVTGELYVLGRSVFNLISSGAQLAGLAAGGAVIAALGPSTTFAVAAAVQLGGLLGVVAVPAARVPAAGDRWHPGETWHGNLELLRNPRVRRILLSWWVPTALLVGAESLAVAYVAERGGSAGATGGLLAAFPGGAAVGDLVVGRWLPAGARRRAVPWLFVLVGVALVPLGWHPPVAVAAACVGTASAATAYQLGGQRAFLDAVPDARRGLAFGLLGTGVMTGQGLGPVVSGAVADGVGAGVTIAVLGLAVLVSATRLARLPSA